MEVCSSYGRGWDDETFGELEGKAWKIHILNPKNGGGGGFRLDDFSGIQSGDV